MKQEDITQPTAEELERGCVIPVLCSRCRTLFDHVEGVDVEDDECLNCRGLTEK
jgi:hypothetical protein